MKTHKVGQDIFFTDRKVAHVTGTNRAVWLLAALTVSFFVTESLVVFIGK